MEALEGCEVIYGINPVSEILKNGERPVLEILVSRKRGDRPLKGIVELARMNRVTVRSADYAEISSRADTKNHQGVAAFIAAVELLPLNSLIEKAFSNSSRPVVALLDEIQDPGNLGSIIRSAEVLGVDGVVITKERSSGLTSTVFKRSAGALAHIPVSRVTNLNQTISLLKERGFWVVGIEAEGSRPCFEYDFDSPAAIVIGSEGRGVRRLVRKNCDEVLSIPMEGAVSSLNAASAAAVVFYEILRQKILKTRHPDI